MEKSGGATDDHMLPFDSRADWESVTRAIAATHIPHTLRVGRTELVDAQRQNGKAD